MPNKNTYHDVFLFCRNHVRAVRVIKNSLHSRYRRVWRLMKIMDIYPTTIFWDSRRVWEDPYFQDKTTAIIAVIDII